MRLAQLGAKLDGLMAELEGVENLCASRSISAEVLGKIATGRATNLYASLGQGSRLTESGTVAMTPQYAAYLSSAWLEGFLTGLVSIDEPPSGNGGFVQLSELCRNLDTMAEEKGIEAFARDAGYDIGAVHAFSTRKAKRMLEMVKEETGYSDQRLDALCPLFFMDGFQVGLLATKGFPEGADIPREEL